jgi:hypothetical protein
MKHSDYPYESFNARALSPRQVAGGFVPPESFRKLLKRRHSIVAGPRGSGKTTLLKMLQVSALRAWSHRDAEELRSQVDFTGVFIPTDRTWGEQLSSLGSDHLNAQQQELLGVAAFTTQVLRATVSSCIERLDRGTDAAAPNFRKIEITAKQELEFASQLASVWALSPDAPTLLGLRAALGHRLVLIHQLAGKCALLPAEERNRLLAHTDYLHLNFLSAVPAFLDIYEAVTGSRDEKWALLFDELELAPAKIRESLSQALRSVDQRLLFKLSIAPFSRELEESVKAASDKNDFDLIRLWYPSKEDGYPFSQSLITEMLARRNLPGDLTRTFGLTFGETSKPRSGKREYDKARFYKSLAAKDESFRQYLSKAGISATSISLPSEREQAATLRKVVSLVIVRDAYLKGRSGNQDRPSIAQRTRKSTLIYCGVPALLAVSEGNPRWLIGIIDSLLENLDSDGRVPVHAQDREITGLISRFSAFLKTIPNNSHENRATNIYGLIDSIGKSFTHEILGKPFNADPVGTFLVDSNTPEDQIRALEQAIYAGAIVFVPESDSEIATGSLKGKRFRLTYLLAPKYKLPLVLLRPKSLASVLAQRGSDQDLFSESQHAAS